MAYLRSVDDNETLSGPLGCGAGCGCDDCRGASGRIAGFDEYYVPEEEDDGAPEMLTRAANPQPAASVHGFAAYGEPSPQLRMRPTDEPQLRMPAFETITGFAPGIAALSAGQADRVNHAADFIARSWDRAAPITSVRITGYIDRSEWQPELGQRRAAAVRDALIHTLESLRPGLVRRLRWIIEDRGLSTQAKVEIYLWAGPTPPPVPPLVRIPSPAEATRRSTPAGQETVEERIRRVINTSVPTRPSRSFSQMFWKKVDDSLNSTMARWNVPQSLRGPIREAAHAALKKGAETVLQQALDQTPLGDQAKKAIQVSVRAAAQYRPGEKGGQTGNRMQGAPLGAWGLGQIPPAAPRFAFECPAGCAPVAAGQCRAVLRQAITAAISLANKAAEKLEANPRDAETIRLFRFFFGHDPSRPVPWAGNRESGISVAQRLRKVAEALQSRGTLYRCGCPGAGPEVRAQTNAATEPNVINLCTRFWNPPAGLRVSHQFFRAGVILHEMLHLLYHEFFHHAGHPSGDPERRRDNSHCYEAFTMRVAGHAADPSDVRQCTQRPA